MFELGQVLNQQGAPLGFKYLWYWLF